MLIDNADKASLSKKLVTLDQHVDLDVPVGDLAVHAPDYRNLIAFLKAMEFSTLTRRIGEIAKIDVSSVEPAAKLKSGEVAITSPAPDVEGPVKTKADEGLPLTGGSAKPAAKANGQHPFTPAARAAANLAANGPSPSTARNTKPSARSIA